MTIGIVVCLPDGALLATDDRRTRPFVPNAKPIDNANKITRIGNTIAVISFGLEIATSIALSKIDRNKIDSSSSPGEIISHIEQCTSFGWEYLCNNLGEDVDPTAPAMRAAFLVAGYPSNSKINFVGGSLFRPNGHDKPTLEFDYLKFIVLGGEDHDSQKIFHDNASLSLSKISQYGAGIMDTRVTALLEACAQTIRQIAKVDAHIGNGIRYAIIRRGYQYCEQWY